MDRAKIEKFLKIAAGKKVPKWQLDILIKIFTRTKQNCGKKSSEY